MDEIVIDVNDNNPVSPKKSQRIVKLVFGA